MTPRQTRVAVIVTGLGVSLYGDQPPEITGEDRGYRKGWDDAVMYALRMMESLTKEQM